MAKPQSLDELLRSLLAEMGKLQQRIGALNVRLDRADMERRITQQRKEIANLAARNLKLKKLLGKHGIGDE